MKLSLDELNKYMWYRAMKVVYFISYAIIFSIGFFLAIGTGYYEAPDNLPNSVNEAIQDNNFYELSSSEMISVLEKIDSNFKKLSEAVQQEVITELYRQKGKNATGKANFIYFQQTEFSLIKALPFSFIYILAVLATMESIRRCFYYVVIGKFSMHGRK